MSILKKVIGGAKIAGAMALGATGAGAGTAIPLAASGASDLAASDPKPIGQSTPATQRQVGNAASGPPMSASSVEDARGQGQKRMKSIYNYP